MSAAASCLPTPRSSSTSPRTAPSHFMSRGWRGPLETPPFILPAAHRLSWEGWRVHRGGCGVALMVMAVEAVDFIRWKSA
eukprot:1382060-Prymnesium_polylepis.1